MSEGKKRSKRSPKEKKKLELEREKVMRRDRPNGFRKGWPQKKAHVERSYRHALKQALVSVAPDDSEAVATAVAKKRPRRHPASLSLAEAIAVKKARRERR